jgi:transposase
MPSAKEPPWELSDALWARIEPLLPKEPPKTRRRGRGRGKGGRPRRKVGGRPRVPPRQVFAGILYVLRTGCQWKALPAQYTSGSTAHLWFQRWEQAGVFRRVWRAGLAEYDELQGIAWQWQAADGALTKAPLGGAATGPNPTDRGKKRHQAPPPGGRDWRPALPRRQRGQRQ